MQVFCQPASVTQAQCIHFSLNHCLILRSRLRKYNSVFTVTLIIVACVQLVILNAALRTLVSKWVNNLKRFTTAAVKLLFKPQ